MKYRTLEDGLTVSALGLGCMPMAGASAVEVVKRVAARHAVSAA